MQQNQARYDPKEESNSSQSVAGATQEAWCFWPAKDSLIPLGKGYVNQYDHEMLVYFSGQCPEVRVITEDWVDTSIHLWSTSELPADAVNTSMLTVKLSEPHSCPGKATAGMMHM